MKAIFTIILMIAIVSKIDAGYNAHGNNSSYHNTIDIQTMNPYQYRYVPMFRRDCFSFWVKGKYEAHISLSNTAQYVNPRIKILLGGWNNAESAIVLNDALGRPISKTSTPGILSGAEYRGFWIHLSHNGDISVGRVNEFSPFLIYRRPDGWFPINFVGVTCGRAEKCSWTLEMNPVCPEVIEY